MTKYFENEIIGLSVITRIPFLADIRIHKE